jgi:cytochrome b561
MPALTILLGLVLVLLGVAGYFGTEADGRSVTALIPAFFGLPIALLGAVALVKSGAKKHAMHAAVALALLGAIGAGMQGLPKLGALVSDYQSLERPMATLMQVLMTAVCIVLVVAGGLSFVKARKQAA